MATSHWVNIYEVVRVRGGEENGGWFYNKGTLVDSVPCPSKAIADHVADNLRLKVQYAGVDIYKEPGSEYQVRIETKPGVDFPETPPVYE